MNLIKKIQEKIQNKYFDFRPYKIDFNIDTLRAEFFIGTSQAKEWYDPLKPHTKLEYEWVLNNIDLNGKKIIDGGAHHGQYAVFFAKAAGEKGRVITVDPIPMNCTLTEVNMKLNDLNFEILQAAITNENGTTKFADQSNGAIISNGSLDVKTVAFHEIMPDVEIVKLDVERYEFIILPVAIEKLPNVKAWIVEMHPDENNDPNSLAQLFLNKGYEIKWLNKEKNIIENYISGTKWNIHSTLFATKP